MIPNPTPPMTTRIACLLLLGAWLFAAGCAEKKAEVPKEFAPPPKGGPPGSSAADAKRK